MSNSILVVLSINIYGGNKINVLHTKMKRGCSDLNPDKVFIEINDENESARYTMKRSSAWQWKEPGLINRR